MIDLNNLFNPIDVFTMYTPGNAVAVKEAGEWVYLADQDGGLMILHKGARLTYLPFLRW